VRVHGLLLLLHHGFVKLQLLLLLQLLLHLAPPPLRALLLLLLHQSLLQRRRLQHPVLREAEARGERYQWRCWDGAAGGRRHVEPRRRAALAWHGLSSGGELRCAPAHQLLVAAAAGHHAMYRRGPLVARDPVGRHEGVGHGLGRAHCWRLRRQARAASPDGLSWHFARSVVGRKIRICTTRSFYFGGNSV